MQHVRVNSFIIFLSFFISGISGCSSINLITDSSDIELDYSVLGTQKLPLSKDMIEIRKKFRLDYVQEFIDPESCEIESQRRIEDLNNYLTYNNISFRLSILVEQLFSNGNLNESIPYLKKSLYRKKPTLKNVIFASQLSRIYSRLGKENKALKYLGTARSFSSGSKWGKKGESGKAIAISLAKAEIMRLKGNPVKEELLLRSAIEKLQYVTVDWFNVPPIKARLAKSVLLQGRYAEAESIAVEIANDSRTFYDRSGEPLQVLAEALFKQHRYDDAAFVAKAAFYSHQVGCTSEDSSLFRDTLKILHASLAATGQFKLLKQLSPRESYDPNHILANILLDSSYLNEKQVEVLKNLSDQIESTDHRLAIKALALISAKQRNTISLQSKYYELFNNIRELKSTSLYTPVFNQLLDEYADLLLTSIKVNRNSEASRLLEVKEFQKNLRTDQALQKAAFRSSISDPELSGKIRQHQDLTNKINSLSETISFYNNTKHGQIDPKTITNTKKLLAKTNLALSILEKEFNDSLIDQFNSQRQKSFNVDKLKLSDNESILIYHTHRDQYLIWAISPKHDITFHLASISPKTIRSASEKVYASLSFDIDSNKILDQFDIRSANLIYKFLFEPIQASLSHSDTIYLAKTDSLKLVPFSALVTSLTGIKPPSRDFNPDNSTTRGLRVKSNNLEDGSLLGNHANYSSIPWLAHKFAFAELPSASSFLNIAHSETISNVKTKFIGYGNPIFNKDRYRDMEIDLAFTDNKFVYQRNVSTFSSATQPTYYDLTHLPETEYELKHIALSLGADLNSVYIKDKANEWEIEQANLKDLEVLAIATHGLVPGEIDGLYEPALALSKYSSTNKNYDGLLTMSEVMNLDLDVDFVILSACNTAKGDGRDDEPYTGLTRAFFYAGAKSLLVSNWPVETVSAMKLTTNMLKQWKSNKQISKAKALNNAMLSLMKTQSYSHPAFWAPFSIVGSGR